jgi:DNA-binding response OmpR family regulator
MASKSKKILLAEDDSFLATLLKTRLVREGFEVATASNGDEVIPLLNKEKPDLLLLDIILPGKGGHEILEDLKKSKSKPPFMVISNLAQEEDMSRAKEQGAIEYFVKARISLDDLVSKVKTFLAK